MTEYYFNRLSDGALVTASSVQEIAQKAQREADKFGQAVAIKVREWSGGAGRKSHRIHARVNPTGAEIISKLSREKYQVTGVSPNSRSRTVAYASSKAEAEALKQQLSNMRYSQLVIKPASWQKNPTDKKRVTGWATVNPRTNKRVTISALKANAEEHARKWGLRVEPVYGKWS